MPDRNAWLVTKAVVRGKSHIDRGMPCQDYCDVQVSHDGRWLVAVVSDGAGTAARAEEGARLVAQHVARSLLDEIAKIETRGPGVWLKDRVHATLIDVREQLRDAGPDIRAFSSTLVGVLVGPTGGFFFHIGDGAALGSHATLLDGPGGDQGAIGLWTEIVISEPENGEFANETFFVTQDDWDKHLRSSILSGGTDIVVLMSDGAMPFVVQNGMPNSPFIDPLIAQLLRTPDAGQRDRLVQQYLESPETYPITNDDKTLFIGLRSRLTSYAGYKIVSAPPIEKRLPQPTEPVKSDDCPMTPEDRPNRVARIDYAGLHPPETDVPNRNSRLAGWAIFLSTAALLVAFGALALGTWNFVGGRRERPPAMDVSSSSNKPVQPDTKPSIPPERPPAKRGD
jgi:hypothetical protein